MKTRPFIFAIFLSVSMAIPAWARLGESESDVIARYGKPHYKMHRTYGDEEGFTMNGFTITVTLIQGVSRGELFVITPGHTITEDQEVDLLGANSEGYSWTDAPPEDIPKHAYPPIKQMWVRPNGSTAVLTASSIEFKSIFLILAQEDAAKQKPAAPSTQGF